MIPTYHFREDKQLQLFNKNPQSSSSSPPSLSSHPFTYSIPDQEGCDNHSELHHIEYQQEASNFAMNGGSHDHHHSDRGLKLSLWKTEERNENERDRYGSAKVMPFKLRLMRKMSTDQMKFGDQKQQSSPTKTENSSNNNPIRVCSDCNTTKTPLWRSGPRGPKSLCNACGIRQRKARRAMAAAAAAANGTIFEETVQVKAKVQHVKAKRSKYGHVAQFKKRSKLATNGTPSHGLTKKLCFEDFLISLSKNSAFHRVFPQDEKDAAILLMALSCGFVHG
ncbi:GATA type zinc finger transcription factor family protein [Actinidia rufa]|uniref:GATA type zinc finger transcription factor family protein n=1 Tax=Actinidia rufa TaxID=165716 RepID=A0A7J0FKL1_9ERIC|nr:GATA type zinc finger transcription factor family protein [Actinidia rufa]